MRSLVVAVIAGLLVLAVPASADQQILAASGQRYAQTTVTIAQGERLTFRNDDNVQHDVTSTQDRDAKPLFATPLVDPKGEAVVEGSQYLTTGEYAFVCSIHPDMQGKLIVSADGTPVPRPGSAGAPTLKAAAARLAAVRKAKALVVTLAGPAGSDAIVAARATLGGKAVTLAKRRVTLDSTDAQRIVLPLSSKARAALKGQRKVAVTFKATVLAASGSLKATARRTYR